jgi:hypothetical protein
MNTTFNISEVRFEKNVINMSGTMSPDTASRKFFVEIFDVTDGDFTLEKAYEDEFEIVWKALHDNLPNQPLYLIKRK